MSSSKLTSTGHVLSDASWLDVHFESARPEYEDALRHVRVQPGWTILDAGCGGGGFLPLMCELVGPLGIVVALDLAPENIARVEALARDANFPAKLETRVGSILALPFDDATFDCVWNANVTQYLTEAEFACAMAEFKRVLKPGGTLAIKEFDGSLLQLVPMNPSAVASFMVAHKANFAERGVLGTCGTSLPSRLRRAGLTDIWRKEWLVQRWAPVGPHTRRLVEEALAYWAGKAAEYQIPADYLRVWREAATNPGSLIDDPDFCFQEAFVLAVGLVVSSVRPGGTGPVSISGRDI